jgi:cob(I)alamin adenosyltransferase
MAYVKKWTGDKGETHLRSGMKTSKKSLRVEAYGTVDELNSFVGLAAAESGNSRTREILNEIQEDLFAIGADLSAPMYEKIRRINDERNRQLEDMIKEIDSELEDLKNFIIPGGTRAASLLHVCRTICRRAERQIVALKEQEKINEEALKYMNRLSDVFFQLARLENKKQGRDERIWKE